jgi:hypothetical protein
MFYPDSNLMGACNVSTFYFTLARSRLFETLSFRAGSHIFLWNNMPHSDTRLLPIEISASTKFQNNKHLESVGSKTRDRVKLGPGLVRKIADVTIFNQSKGKSGSYAHAARVGIEYPTIFNQSKGKSGPYDHAAHVGMQNHSKGKSLLHLTSLI